ncbi:MAG: ABC transporter substrate-binding protein [Spirochaetaceae bacterium]|jgi:iron complex transport system substrate-binding protein|nr:ABC transporter substrate-binding protein [Spirochaetaceae bacterium]
MRGIGCRIIFFVLLLPLGGGCGKGKENPSSSGGAAAGSAELRHFTDPSGGVFTLAGIPERIISSAPSNTEIVIDLGLGKKLIAVDAYSAGLEGLADNLPLIDFAYPDAEAIIALRPDLILASEHNRIGENDPFRLIREAGIGVAYIPTSGGIAGIYRDIDFIAGLLGVRGRGERLSRSVRETIDRIGAIGSAIPERKTVYFEISPPPHIVSFGRGTFLHEMLELIGAENIFAETTGWIAPGAEAIVAADPQVILTNAVVPGGAGLTGTLPDPVKEILARPGFGGVRAVRNRAVYRIDADSSSRPNHRIIRALHEMARAVYPEYYE